jgi:hypothetical protein
VRIELIGLVVILQGLLNLIFPTVSFSQARPSIVIVGIEFQVLLIESNTSIKIARADSCAGLRLQGGLWQLRLTHGLGSHFPEQLMLANTLRLT